MLDTVNETLPPEGEDKITLTAKPEVKPTLVCTVMSDGSLKLSGQGIHMLELQGLLLTAAARITGKVVERAMATDRVLTMITSRCQGFDEETEQAIAALLPRR